MQRSPPGALLRALLALGYVCAAFLAFRSWPQLHRQVEAVASEFTINSAIHFVVQLDLTCTYVNVQSRKHSSAAFVGRCALSIPELGHACSTLLRRSRPLQ